MLLTNLLKQFLRSMNTINLIVVEEEEQFQSSNTCWICEKRTHDNDEKVKDYCHITKKLREAIHWNRNINLQLTKVVLAIFHNLRGYDSHQIFCELNKFDVKIDVIPNRLQKYVAFILNKNLVFIDSMQFMNPSLEKLVKNLSDNDFKHLTEEFGSEKLELLKVLFLVSTWTVLKDLIKKNCLIKSVFTAL